MNFVNTAMLCLSYMYIRMRVLTKCKLQYEFTIGIYIITKSMHTL